MEHSKPKDGREHESGSGTEESSYDEYGKPRRPTSKERPIRDIYNELKTSFGFPSGNYRLYEDEKTKAAAKCRTQLWSLVIPALFALQWWILYLRAMAHNNAYPEQTNWMYDTCQVVPDFVPFSTVYKIDGYNPL